MASITARGFCALAALSRKTRGLPRISVPRIGKSARTRSTSSWAPRAPALAARAAAQPLEQELAERLGERGPRRAPRSTSAAKPWTSRSRAAASPMPRERR